VAVVKHAQNPKNTNQPNLEIPQLGPSNKANLTRGGGKPQNWHKRWGEKLRMGGTPGVCQTGLVDLLEKNGASGSGANKSDGRETMCHGDLWKGFKKQTGGAVRHHLGESRRGAGKVVIRVNDCRGKPLLGHRISPNPTDDLAPGEGNLTPLSESKQ